MGGGGEDLEGKERGKRGRAKGGRQELRRAARSVSGSDDEIEVEKDEVEEDGEKQEYAWRLGMGEKRSQNKEVKAQ